MSSRWGTWLSRLKAIGCELRYIIANCASDSHIAYVKCARRSASKARCERACKANAMKAGCRTSPYRPLDRLPGITLPYKAIGFAVHEPLTQCFSSFPHMIGCRIIVVRLLNYLMLMTNAVSVCSRPSRIRPGLPSCATSSGRLEGRPVVRCPSG